MKPESPKDIFRAFFNDCILQGCCARKGTIICRGLRFKPPKTVIPLSYGLQSDRIYSSSALRNLGFEAYYPY